LRQRGQGLRQRGLRQRGQIAFFTHQIRKRKKQDIQLARTIDAVIEYYEKSELTPFATFDPSGRITGCCRTASRVSAE
jgi:hypothetical protein